MNVRRFAALAALVVMVSVSSAWAQSQTGEIFGRVTDPTGAVLPGVTVTLTSPVLLQALTATTSETGSYQFPRLAVSTYDVRFELASFGTVIKKDIQVTVGFSANVSAQLGLSNLQEGVTVTSESPIVDTRQTGTRQTFTIEQLQNIPSARDPWVILQQTAGIAMDRENIGGNMSGQQSNYVSRGANPTNNKWSLDGVDITDMAATGASPMYYDFDAFQEMTINTGGVDVTQQTGGVGINLVTKSGSDRFRGSTRYYNTNERFESNNITDAMRSQGASSGNPIQDIKDFGFEVGGPIKRGRAWAWGSFGKQDINVGVLNFYKPDATCQSYKSAATALAAPVKEVNKCLNADNTLLQTTNLKGEVQLFDGNKLSLFSSFSKKERNARGASDLNPIETTSRQAAVTSNFGRSYWITGPSPTYKFGDQWLIGDRLVLDVQYAHVGNNFILDFHEDSLTTVQPALIVSTGLNLRSASQSIFLRPVNSLNFNASYFLPAAFGADHALKIGGYWRDAYSESIVHVGGYATARFPTQAAYDTNTCATGVAAGCAAALTRDNHSTYRLTNIAVYMQDTVTRGRMTFQLGLRYDRNHDQALAATIPASGILPALLPAVSFGGVDPGIVFNDFSPRVGLTYDLRGDGRTIARVNYARYFGQVGTGAVADQVNPLGAVTVRYPWFDLNGDRFVQADEVRPTDGNFANFQALSGNWDPANPSSPSTANTIDPALRNDTTDEFIVGMSREIGRGFAVDANYIWRRYDNFNQSFTNGISSADYLSTQYTPTCTVAGARCETVTAYYPSFQLSGITTRKNTPNFHRSFNGFELMGRKRMANRWMMNTSVSYNSAIQYYGEGSYQNPNNISVRNGHQYDYSTSGSGIGNVFVNAKWLFKLSGMYELPYAFNVSAFYNARQGYPFEAAVILTNPIVLTTTGQSVSALPNGGGTPTIILDNIGDDRLPNFQNLDLHVERPVSLGQVRLVPSLDVFNVTNNNTIQALRGNQNATNANNIQAIVAPRVLRFGLRMTW
jgi:Carboxypeptidase regulatory-like domain/TonB-dependent Receptor Plug Domain